LSGEPETRNILKHDQHIRMSYVYQECPINALDKNQQQLQKGGVLQITAEKIV